MSEFSDIPMIKLELEGMRKRIGLCLNSVSDEWNKMIEERVLLQITPEYIGVLLSRYVKEEVDEAIKKASTYFFMRGEGRKMINELVIKKLTKEVNKTNEEDLIDERS